MYQYTECGCNAPCWRCEGSVWSATCHDELDGDGQRELLPVAAVDFFDQDEHKEGQDANKQLGHSGARQQTAKIHQRLEDSRAHTGYTGQVSQ